MTNATPALDRLKRRNSPWSVPLIVSSHYVKDTNSPSANSAIWAYLLSHLPPRYLALASLDFRGPRGSYERQDIANIVISKPGRERGHVAAVARTGNSLDAVLGQLKQLPVTMMPRMPGRIMGRSRQAAIGATFSPIVLTLKVRAMAGGALHRIRDPPSFEIDDGRRPDRIPTITEAPDHHPPAKSNRPADRDRSEKSEHLPAR